MRSRPRLPLLPLAALLLAGPRAPPSARCAAAAAAATSGHYLRGLKVLTGTAAPEPDPTERVVEEEAEHGLVEELMYLEDEVEALEARDDDAAGLVPFEEEVLKEVGEDMLEMEQTTPDETPTGDDIALEKKVLASTDAALVRAALPPGCNLKCFFDNHAWLAEKMERSEEVAVTAFLQLERRVPPDIWEHACDCHGASAVLEEIVHVEEDIAELEHRDGDEAALEKEVLASVAEGLAEAALPSGCDLDCFFDKLRWLADEVEHTEEAVLEYMQQNNTQVPSDACFCHNGTSAVGEAAALPDSDAAEEGAIEQIVELGAKIEELEHQGGDAADREEEVLASVEAELIQAALPPGCNLECFFDNHQWLTDKIEHTEEAVVEHFQKRWKKIPKDMWEHACDCHGEAAVIEEIDHLEEELDELEKQDGDEAKLEMEVLESVEEELLDAVLPVLPSGCDLDCFFNNRPKIANSIEHTEEAVLDFFRKKNRRVPSHACFCDGRGVPVVGEAAPEPGAVEGGAIEEIVQVGARIEALERGGGAGAAWEEEVLASVEAELIRAALPPGCNLECFFDNHQWLADKIEHTEEAVVEHFQKRWKKIPKDTWEHACDCGAESAVIEEIVHLEEELEELEDQDGDEAKREKEVLESVEAGLIKAALPPDCDLDCFFDNHDFLAKKLEHTEEAVLEFFQKKNREIPSAACACPGESTLPFSCDLDCFFANHDWLAKHIEHTEEAVLGFYQKMKRNITSEACACPDGSPVLGDAAPDPDAVEEGAIEEIVYLEEEIEKLENQDGNGTARVEEVLASVEGELIEAALPPGCDLNCFFENHEHLASKIEHTEEAVLEHFQKQKKRIGAHACDCPGETTETTAMAETGS